MNIIANKRFGFSQTLINFLFRLIAVSLLWIVLYELYAKPLRLIDRPLTTITTIGTANVVQFFYKDTHTDFTKSRPIIVTNSNKIIGIDDSCNALELMALYIGLLICLPGRFLRKSAFILSGITVIYCLNILRCLGIAWLNINHHSWVDFGHHLAFKGIVFLFVFYMWVVYMKNVQFNRA